MPTTHVPIGAVTFAFTDIEGSTARWERDRAAMREALRRHDAILRAAVTKHGGHVFKTMGDAFCAAFTRPDDAVAAMLAAQQALAAEDFSAIDGLHVRAAIHTGTADERDGDYSGPAVNRVARLLAIGHGGQILISGVARDLAHDDLPDGASLVDLGSYYLRDFTEAERVWQLDIAGLPNEFPPLRSRDALPNNLPVARTTFVGREEDVGAVKELLEHHRLLTLVGPGGVGKTRLAIQVGAELLGAYSDGVWFVDLAPIGDPELVASVVAQALGMSQQQERRVDEAIPQWLKRKKLLLIFDNCEHILGQTAALADAILATAPDVRILATSREGLDISGEAVHRVPSLRLPAEGSTLDAELAARYGAIALFVDRAKAADTRFSLTDDTAPAVAEICRHLDGIPLAIELAAARVRVLSPAHLLQRLNERFKILTGGKRTAVPRQQTLTALIDWSYNLLSPSEQRLFNRLGIFVGGVDLDAIAAVCGEGLDDLKVLDLLSSLTDKSLLVADTSREQECYRLLESTSAYALGKLAASGEREGLARCHAQYFSEDAEAADERRGSGSTMAWLARAEAKLDNYRAALEWTLTQGNDAVLGGAIAGALRGLWRNVGLTVEGRYWIERALQGISEAEQPAIAARLYLTLSGFLPGKRRYDAAERAMRLYESVNDARGAARAQRQRGWALYQMGQLEEARKTAAQALSRARACGDTWSLPDCQTLLAGIETEVGDLAAARGLYAQALAGYNAVGEEPGAAHVLGGMAELEFAAGDPEQALRLANDALETILRGKNARTTAICYTNSAAFRIALDDLEGARESAREGLRLARQVQSELSLTNAIQHLALLAALRGDARRGARLLGYADAHYDQVGLQRESTERWGYGKLLAKLRESLSTEEIERLADEGAAWSEDKAVEEALKI